MPRLPPVTKITWPLKASGGMGDLQERVEGLQVLDVVHGRGWDDLFHQRGQGALGADLDKSIHPEPGEPENTGRPADRAGQLPHHQVTRSEEHTSELQSRG